MSDTAPQHPDDRPAAAPPRILYCRCAYAKVVPQEVKDEVLRRLCESDQPFDTAADLCEMSARRDPSLQPIAAVGGVQIVACYERAVRGLFEAAGAPLPAAGVTVLNMRTQNADQITQAILNPNPAEAPA